MTSRALGLIEVRGYLGAVVAADAALKAANVSLVNIETVKSGLNTVQLIGDVSAVKSAVDAAVSLVQDKPYYLASHVIARMDQQTEILFSSRESSKEPSPTVFDAIEGLENGLVMPEILKNDAEPPQTQNTSSLVAEERIIQRYTRLELEKMKVVRLRSLAYKQKEVGLTKKEIKFANKHQLVEALMKIIGKE